MEPKQVTISIVILNLIFIAVFVWLAHTTIFDHWLTSKVLPNLCTEEQADGKVVFTFCEEEPTE
ncbi:hypothetical protein KKF38_03915 [Patescibacteria group bacterium]|nr:hypothetical protein [Patescibacteria group bacterium]